MAVDAPALEDPPARRAASILSRLLKSNEKIFSDIEPSFRILF